jgi:hypothetical protein
MKIYLSVAAIFLVASLNGCVLQKQSIQCFEFRGDSYSPSGHFYQLSVLELRDSSFMMTDYTFNTGRERRIGKAGEQKNQMGKIQTYSDTIICTTTTPKEYEGSRLLFVRCKGKLTLLDFRGMPLQHWRPCKTSWVLKR